jgi:hypothetical protein
LESTTILEKIWNSAVKMTLKMKNSNSNYSSIGLC